MGVSVDRADNVLRGDLDAIGLLDDIAEGEAQAAVAPLKKLKDMGMIVKGVAGTQFEFFDDHGGADPLQESFVDHGGKRVAADGADAPVALDVHVDCFAGIVGVAGDGGLLAASKLAHGSSLGGVESAPTDANIGGSCSLLWKLRKIGKDKKVRDLDFLCTHSVRERP